MQQLAITVGMLLALTGCGGSDQPESMTDDTEVAGPSAEWTGDEPVEGSSTTSITTSTTVATTVSSANTTETTTPVENDDAAPTEEELDPALLALEDLGFGWTQFPPSRDVLWPCGLEPETASVAETAWVSFAQNQELGVTTRLLSFESSDQAVTYIREVESTADECDDEATPSPDGVNNVVFVTIPARRADSSYWHIGWFELATDTQYAESVLAYVAEGQVVVAVQVTAGRERDPVMDRQLDDLLDIAIERVRSIR